MVTFLSSIGKVLWELFVVGIGCLSIFLTILFLADLFLDLVKDIWRRIKK